MFRKYTYLVALARERHFGRAAAACNVSQPTLSNAIRQLEESLGVSIVERGQKFQGFTTEGLRVLDHARRVLSEQEALEQSLNAGNLELAGTLHIGVVPTALPVVAELIAPFADVHRRVRFSVRSMASQSILRGLSDFELDLGISYMPGAEIQKMQTVPLYEESYFLLTSDSRSLEGRERISWSEASKLPLCLLSPDMQNRQIIDAAFRDAGVGANPEIETNSLMNLFTNVRTGRWSSIIPGQLLTVMPTAPGLRSLPMAEPALARQISLFAMDRDPPSAIVQAMLALARGFDSADMG